MSHLSHSLNGFVQKMTHLKTSDSYELVIWIISQTDCFKNSDLTSDNCIWVSLLNHWPNWFVQKLWFNETSDSCLFEWVFWIIDPTDSFKNSDSMKQVTVVFLSESFESFTQLIRSKTDSFRYEHGTVSQQWLCLE